MEVLFCSRDGGDRLRERILEVIREAAEMGRTDRVALHVMTFSFTDEAIAALVADVARSRPNVSVRIIADWSQGSEGAGRRVRALARLGLANLLVRYKNDQPYVWDPELHRVRWSYHASRGLLHHKTLAVLVDGRPHTLVCGSFNWTIRAANSYENLIVFDALDDASATVMTAVEQEFEALWSDGRATLSPEEVTTQYRDIIEEYERHPSRPPDAIVGCGGGADTPLAVLQDSHIGAGPAVPGQALVAFSSRSPHQAEAQAGYARENRARRFELHKPSGKTKRAPVTLTTLALDTIARAGPGDRLLVAMYGLSIRVPEYGALLEAARRGVRLRILLDGQVCRPVLVQLATAAHREDLPIRLRGGTRPMHQKYVVHPEGQAVLTGTANLSTDASNRHSEHRLLWRGDPAVTAAFVADFDMMWARLSPPFRTSTTT